LNVVTQQLLQIDCFIRNSTSDGFLSCVLQGAGNGSTAHELQRIAFHVSMSPKSFATEATLAERREAAVLGVRTGT
jgi:hypothetical protein